MGHECGAHPQQGRVEAEQSAGDEPGDRGAGQATSGELGEARGDAGTGERGAAEPLHRGADQRGPARHRGEHHVGDVGGLERERSALGAAAQTGHEREDGDHPEHGRTVFGDVRGLCGAELGVADQVAQPEQEDAAEQADDVHLVRGVEPLHVAEAVPFAGGPQRMHGRRAGARRIRRRRRGSRRVEHGHPPSSAGRRGSADQPDQLATYSRGGVKPACSIATMFMQALTPEPQ